jgi:phosphinothricin acetyltransferase
MTEPRVRPATAQDLDAINVIYNHYVVRSTCSYELEPETAAGRRAWFAAHDEAHPVVVAEADGIVVGWGALAPYHVRPAYRHTVEDSVYVRHDLRGRGLGTRLLTDLVDRAGRIGHHAVVALISADHPVSVRLHARLGFGEVGRLREVGRKFGRWLDVVFMQRLLRAPGGGASLPPRDAEAAEREDLPRGGAG